MANSSRSQSRSSYGLCIAGAARIITLILFAKIVQLPATLTLPEPQGILD
jgi:hypothetical protein